MEFSTYLELDDSDATIEGMMERASAENPEMKRHLHQQRRLDLARPVAVLALARIAGRRQQRLRRRACSNSAIRSESQRARSVSLMRILIAAPRKSGNTRLRCLLASLYGLNAAYSRGLISGRGRWRRSNRG